MPYQWTPGMVYHPSFGFYLLTNFPDKKTYQVYFDQVKITVEYSCRRTSNINHELEFLRTLFS
jgi:hypothetical protein